MLNFNYDTIPNANKQGIVKILLSLTYKIRVEVFVTQTNNSETAAAIFMKICVYYL